MNIIYCTASVLKCILYFIDAENTPKIAYDRDDMAEPLRNKIKEALGDRDGSQSVTIYFSSEEKELLRQFNGVAKNIEAIFKNIDYCSKTD